MKKLELALQQLKAEEREAIIEDFQEHFAIGKQQGKSEDEIATSLGEPQQIAKEMLASYHLESVGKQATAGNVVRATWAVIGLSFFNLVVVLGPFVAFASVIVAGWVSGVGLMLSPLLVILAAIVFPDQFEWFNLFSSLIIAGIGILLSFGMYYLTRWMRIGFVRYLKYNSSLVKGGIKE